MGGEGLAGAAGAGAVSEFMSRTQSHYAELPPPRALADRFMCTWTQTIGGVDGGTHPHSVLPDGCVDIVWIGPRAPVVAGPATHRVVVDLPVGISLIGVRIKPGWASSFLGLPVEELKNREVALSDIWSGKAGRMTIEHRAPRSDELKLRTVASAMMIREAVAPRPDFAIRYAVRWLARHPAGRVRDLARRIDMSERQLQRQFAAAVGYAPKAFQRVMRLQRLLMLNARSSRSNLAHLANAAGYADQAHMCRETRTLANGSPADLLRRARSTLGMSDLFNIFDEEAHIDAT